MEAFILSTAPYLAAVVSILSAILFVYYLVQIARGLR